MMKNIVIRNLYKTLLCLNNYDLSNTIIYLTLRSASGKWYGLSLGADFEKLKEIHNKRDAGFDLIDNENSIKFLQNIQEINPTDCIIRINKFIEDKNFEVKKSYTMKDLYSCTYVE